MQQRNQNRMHAVQQACAEQLAATKQRRTLKQYLSGRGRSVAHTSSQLRLPTLTVMLAWLLVAVARLVALAEAVLVIVAVPLAGAVAAVVGDLTSTVLAAPLSISPRLQVSLLAVMLQVLP